MTEKIFCVSINFCQFSNMFSISFEKIGGDQLLRNNIHNVAVNITVIKREN